MLCPWCGSPVMIRGSQWECGWCGDSGVLRRKSVQKPVQKPVQLTLRLSFVYHVELSETWLDLKEALAQLAPKKTRSRSFSARCCCITSLPASIMQVLCRMNRRQKNCEHF